MILRRVGAALVLAAAGLAPQAGAEAPPPGDLPSPGARGVVYTTLEGDEIREIPVTFLGTYRGFAGPGYDLHLVRLEGEDAERVGVAAGMSGSPVWFEGKLLGALSYRLGSLPTEAVGGVTPFEDVRSASRTPHGGAPPGATAGMTGLAPIATPLVAAGLRPELRGWLAGHLAEHGFVMAAAGGTAATPPPADSLRPGSPVGVELVRGDLRIAATGTVTAVEGDTVWAFGHPFFGSGRVEMPMITAEVIHTLADLAGSIKLSNVGQEVGAIVEDRWTAIVGRRGARARMIPLRLDVEGGDYGAQSFDFEIVQNSNLAPLLAATAVANALQIQVGYNEQATVLVDGQVRLEGLPELPIELAFAGEGRSNPTLGLAGRLLQILERLWDNPFGEVRVSEVELRVRARPGIVRYTVEDAWYDRRPVRPGQALRLRCALRRWRGERSFHDLELVLPRELRDGRDLMLAIGGVEWIERVTGRPMLQRLSSVADLDSLVRVLADTGSSRELVAVVFEGGGAVVSHGAAWAGLPPTAERLLASGDERERRPAVGFPVTTLAAREVAVDGPVEGGLLFRLRSNGRLERIEEQAPVPPSAPPAPPPVEPAPTDPPPPETPQ